MTASTSQSTTPRSALRTLYDKPPMSPARAMMLAEELQMTAPEDDEADDDVDVGQHTRRASALAASPARRLLDAFVQSTGQSPSQKRDRAASVGSIGTRSRSRQSSPGVVSSSGAQHGSSPGRATTRNEAEPPAWSFFEDESGTTVELVDLSQVQEAEDEAAMDGQIEDEENVCSNENAPPPPNARPLLPAHLRSTSLLSQSVSATDDGSQTRAQDHSTLPVTPPAVHERTSSTLESAMRTTPTSESAETVIGSAIDHQRQISASPEPDSPPPLYPAWNEDLTLTTLHDAGGLGSFAEGDHGSFEGRSMGHTLLLTPLLAEEHREALPHRSKRKSEEGLEADGEDKRRRLSG
ncbi:hypothetical protein OIO90_001320 [Microbotryomycetes sp. JL221]|nr:hypothetical protein OIO90_001320 [Microbotryomycetes sp. JL221]